jgi:hypothetical protein
LVARWATVIVRDPERASVILLRLDGPGDEAVAKRLRTMPKLGFPADR